MTIKSSNLTCLQMLISRMIVLKEYDIVINLFNSQTIKTKQGVAPDNPLFSK